MLVNYSKKKVFASLPDQLFNCLKDVINTRPDLSMDLAVLIIHFIIHPFKNIDTENGFTNLCATLLRKFNFQSYKYQDHLDFLTKIGLIQMSEYSNRPDGKGKCRGFKINEKYLKNT